MLLRSGRYSTAPGYPRAVQVLNDVDRELHLDGAKSVLLAYREAFDYDANKKKYRF